MKTKKCTKCNATKPLDEFHESKEGKYGRRSTCRACVGIWDKEKRAKRHEIYDVWSNMRSRCNNANNASYKRYGGRGISVCKEWNSFEQFLSDMGNRPTPKHQIDRIDNDGNYESSNCRWVTQAENIRNRNPRKLSAALAYGIRKNYTDAVYTMDELAKICDVSRSTIARVINNEIWKDV